jgi:hypothetical protein
MLYCSGYETKRGQEVHDGLFRGPGMKRNIFWIVPLFFLAAGCSHNTYIEDPGKIFISEKYLDKDRWLVVCKGYPLEDSTGLPRIESAKMAARLNAYVFARQIFDDSVVPDKDGMAEKYDLYNDFVVVYYVIQKKDLKKRMRKK